MDTQHFVYPFIVDGHLGVSYFKETSPPLLLLYIPTQCNMSKEKKILKAIRVSTLQRLAK